jgi:hypothetical protein
LHLLGKCSTTWVMSSALLFSFCFWDRHLLPFCLGWSQTHNPPVSTSRVVGITSMFYYTQLLVLIIWYLGVLLGIGCPFSSQILEVFTHYFFGYLFCSILSLFYFWNFNNACMSLLSDTLKVLKLSSLSLLF